jgi:hypothetical protein
VGERRERFWWRNLREGDHLEDPGVDERIILKYLREVKWGAWTVSIWLRTGTGGSCECCNELLGSIKCG